MLHFCKHRNNQIIGRLYDVKNTFIIDTFFINIRYNFKINWYLNWIDFPVVSITIFLNVCSNQWSSCIRLTCATTICKNFLRRLVYEDECIIVIKKVCDFVSYSFTNLLYPSNNMVQCLRLWRQRWMKMLKINLFNIIFSKTSSQRYQNIYSNFV